MSTTIEIPLELDVVNPTNGNAYFTRQDFQSGYQGVYRFASGDANPVSLMVFKGNIPKNLASPANWNLILHHTGYVAGGVALVRAEAIQLGSGDTPPVPTVLVPNQLVGAGASGDHNITALISTSFDSLMPLTAGKELSVTLMRIFAPQSGDTMTTNWDLRLPPLLRCDVN